ncbi:MAG: hypothetical protein LAT56_00315 [Wenzhouxiangella sp.]|nr:hypothetical protein [Wenzhouxiangella sp.]
MEYTHVCVEACFVNDKLWNIGEKAVFKAEDAKKVGVKQYFKAITKTAKKSDPLEDKE